MKYSSNKEIGPGPSIKWKDFATKFKPEDLYIGGVCGLYYNLNVFEFINKEEPTEFVSVLFISNSIGNDKQRLLITGRQPVFDEQIKSLPFEYSFTNNSQFDKAVLENYLRKIDEEFEAKNRMITLVLNFPLGFLDDLQLSNINIVASEHIDNAIAKTDLLTNCIKNNYRKLQMMKCMVKMQVKNIPLTEYFYLICTAWNNVPYDYIRKLFYYNEEGMSNETKDLSLSQWCKINNVPINDELYNSLDDYVNCDDEIGVFNFTNSDPIESEAMPQNNSVPVSGIEAYQAMKRLISYLQSKRAGAAVMSPARCLENHLECEALLEMHAYVKSENNT